MNASIEARLFTDTLLSTVRLQRHLAARVIISTQEPTISKELLNLCSTTIVHRFTSPEWLQALQGHLAAAATKLLTDRPAETFQTICENEARDAPSIFSKIVHLQVGEALLFSPSAIIGSKDKEGKFGVDHLGPNFLTIKIRSRLTLDGGKSVLS